MNKNWYKLFVFIAAFLIIVLSFIGTVKAEDDEEIFCIICNGDKKTFEMEQQFSSRIKMIKSVPLIKNSIDTIALAATVLHKESSLQAVKSRYNENYDANSYKESMKALYGGSSLGDVDSASSSKEIGADAGVAGEKIDLLNAAAIIMADSAGWGSRYNEESYQKALAGDKLIGNNTDNEVANAIFCSAGSFADRVFSVFNVVYTFASGKDVEAELKRTATRWNNMERICQYGYIGGVYNITPETYPDEKLRQAKKEDIAKEIIDIIHTYKEIVKYQEENCITGGGDTQAIDLKGKSREERIEIVGPAAQYVYSATDVWASVTIGQMIAESGIGEGYESQGMEFFLETNNLMGVKCRTDKCLNGYSVYANIEEAISDRAKMFDNGFYDDWRDKKTPEEFIRYVGPIYCPVSDGCSANYAEGVIDFIDQYDLKKWDVKGSIDCSMDYEYDGVVTEVMKAVAELAKKKAGGGYDGLCEAWAEGIWSDATDRGAPYQESAYSAWKAYGVSTSKTNIPPGAMVFGSGWPYYDDGSNPYGHVGVYVGNGQVADQGKVWDLEEWINQQVAPCNGSTGWFGWGWMGGVDLTKA